jgi:stress-induced morphogen
VGPATLNAVSVTPEELKERIEAGIPGASAEVAGDGHHFNAVVASPAFKGLNRIAQHRLVYDVFGAELGGRIHALSIQTQATEQEAAS